MSPLTFPTVRVPDASVVMVTFGGAETALRALASLRSHSSGIEVIVVDNASPDGAGPAIRDQLSGATVILNDRNLGFAAACNQGAARSRARTVVFLNPDAFVEPGWLGPLLDRIDRDPRVGAVAPRFLNMDGTLQEAGSVVGREGATWAMGAGRDPGDLMYRFPLTVDFASGACLMVRRSAFLEVGGFDVAYHPAYVEDVDLCLALWERGYRVELEPRSSVRHLRSGSTDVASADRMIRRNRGVLLKRWAARLAERFWLEEPRYFPHRVAAARDHRVLERFLLVADDLAPPVPDVVSTLLEGWPQARVTVAGPAPGPEADALAAGGVEMVTHPRGWAAWFEGRRYHASVVIEATERFREHVASTQPQAPVVPMAWVTRDPVEALAGAGVAPPPSR